MNKNTKIGILKYIAKGGAKGIKFEDEPETWYNPSTSECKKQVVEEFIGKTVEIVLVDGEKNKFSSMILLESVVDIVEPEKKELPTIKEEPKEAIEAEKEPKEEISDAQEERNKMSEEEKNDLIEEAITEIREKEIENELIYGMSPVQTMLSSAAKTLASQQYTQKVYSEMEKTKLETAKKGPHKLTYANWAEVWGALKRLHPTSQFKVHENNNGMPVFYSKDTPSMGGFVKVTVTVMGLEHTVHLPVMDYNNKSVTLEKMTTFDINTGIQRALAKCIALHGLGLYVFKGEDYPEESK